MTRATLASQIDASLYGTLLRRANGRFPLAAPIVTIIIRASGSFFSHLPEPLATRVYAPCACAPRTLIVPAPRTVRS